MTEAEINKIIDYVIDLTTTMISEGWEYKSSKYCSEFNTVTTIFYRETPKAASVTITVSELELLQNQSLDELIKYKVSDLQRSYAAYIAQGTYIFGSPKQDGD